MLDTQIILALMGFSLISSITPGPNNLMLLTSGAKFGLLRTLPHLLGVTGGFALMVILVGIGMRGLFQAVPAFNQVLRAISIVYLLYLVWKIATAPCKFGDGRANVEKPMNFVQAALFQWVNPKAWTMAITAVTVYSPSTDHLLALTTTTAIFGAVNLPCVALWAILGTRLRSVLSSPLRFRLFNLTAAALLAATLYPSLR